MKSEADALSLAIWTIAAFVATGTAALMTFELEAASRWLLRVHVGVSALGMVWLIAIHRARASAQRRRRENDHVQIVRRMLAAGGVKRARTLAALGLTRADAQEQHDAG